VAYPNYTDTGAWPLQGMWRITIYWYRMNESGNELKCQTRKTEDKWTWIAKLVRTYTLRTIHCFCIRKAGIVRAATVFFPYAHRNNRKRARWTILSIITLSPRSGFRRMATSAGLAQLPVMAIWFEYNTLHLWHRVSHSHWWGCLQTLPLYFLRQWMGALSQMRAFMSGKGVGD